MATPEKIVVLDRDGVINEDSVAYVKSPEEWRPLAGSLEAIARLSRAGYLVCIATNQSGLARGLFDETMLAQIHQKLRQLLEPMQGRVDGIFYCPHAPDARCHCRKPAPGLLQQIAEQFGVSLEGQCFVGDSLKDLQAARAFNMQPVLVRTGKGAETAATLPREFLGSTPVFNNLAAAVDQYILDAARDATPENPLGTPDQNVH